MRETATAVVATVLDMKGEIYNRLSILEELVGSEAWMWLMVGANHEQAWLSDIREYWEQHKDKLPRYRDNENRLHGR